MIVIVNNRYYAAYDVVHLFLYLTSKILVKIVFKNFFSVYSLHYYLPLLVNKDSHWNSSCILYIL